METIKKQQWEKINNDYKSIIENQKYILKLTDKGSALVPVKIVD
jgi:uncharacterized protein YjgD (DUF1641 family)